jgi:hypothetical protein
MTGGDADLGGGVHERHTALEIAQAVHTRVTDKLICRMPPAPTCNASPREIAASACFDHETNGWEDANRWRRHWHSVANMPCKRLPNAPCISACMSCPCTAHAQAMPLASSASAACHTHIPAHCAAAKARASHSSKSDGSAAN